LQNKKKIDITSQFYRQVNIADNSKEIHNQLTRGGKEVVKRWTNLLQDLKARFNDPHLLIQTTMYVVEREQVAQRGEVNDSYYVYNIVQTMETLYGMLKGLDTNLFFVPSLAAIAQLTLPPTRYSRRKPSPYRYKLTQFPT
jgi:hypothetical protein